MLFITIQIMGTVISLLALFFLISKKSDQEQKFMLTAFGCTLIYCFGILSEYTSISQDAAYVSIKFEYLSSCYLPIIILIFAFRHCRVKLPTAILFLLTLGMTISIIFCFTSEAHSLFCYDLSLKQIGRLSFLSIEHGPVWYLYFALHVIIALLIVWVALYRVLKTPKGSRIKYYIIMICCLLPEIAYLSYRCGLTFGYDYTGIFYLLECLIFYFCIYRLQFFGLVESARDNVIEKMNEALIVVDKKFNIIDVNSAARKIFPELRSGNRGKRIKRGTLLYDLFSKNSYNEFEINGHYYERHLSEITNLELMVLGYFITVIEVTQTHNYVNELINARAAAQAANETKSRYLANASHELRTPMNAIVGFSDLILMQNPPEDIREYVNDINTAAHSLIAIINDILDISKIEAGKLEITNNDYHTKELFSNVASIIKLQADNKNLNFRFTLADKIPRKLCGDVVHLRQVMINLLANAVKYTEVGEVSLDVSFKQQNDETVNLEIKISDTGIGISQEDIPKLFKEFERIEKNVVNVSTEGSGLGLAITKNLVEMMDGTISVESRLSEGSTFTVVIPQTIVDVRPVTIEGTTTNLSETMNISDVVNLSFYAPNARILVVDDSSVNLKLLTSILENYQIKADTAVNGKIAVDMIEQNDYHLVFMDHMMPEMDGVEATKTIRANGHTELPIVALTANAIIGIREFFIENGMSDFVSKPIDIVRLEDIIIKYIPENLITYYNKEIEMVDKELSSVYEKINIPGKSIDVASGYKNCMNNLDTYINIMETFLRTGKTIFNELTAAIEKKDYTTCKLITHTLKNSSYTIGAIKTSTLSREADDALKAGNINLFDLKANLLVTAFSEVLTELSTFFSYKKLKDNELEFTKPKIDSKLVKQKLDELVEQINLMDSVAACETLSFLSSHSYVDKNITVKLVACKNDIQDFEYERAMKKIEEIRAKL